MKICYFLKCSFLLYFVYLSGIIASNLLEKNSISSDKIHNKNLLKAFKSHTEFKNEIGKSSKKFTSFKPKEESKKSHKKEENRNDSHKNENSKKINNENKNELENMKNINPPKNSDRVNSGLESKEKTIATESLKNKNGEGNKGKSSEKSSFSGYFNKTSKSNQSTAGKAFAAFIGGFILFYLSILLICHTERNNVVDTKFNDWVNKEVKHIDLGNDAGDKELLEKQPLLLEGLMSFYEKPVIEGLDLSSQNKSVIRVEIKVEEYITENYEEEGEQKQRTFWFIKNHNVFEGKLLLHNNIVIDLKKNIGFINYDTHFKKENFMGEIDNLKEYLRKQCFINNDFFQKNTNDDEPCYYFLKNDTGAPLSENNFQNGDQKVTLKCYYLEDQKQCLAAGQVMSINKMYHLESADSPIQEVNQGWLFCCFDYGGKEKPLFALYPNTTKKEYIQGLEANTKCYTSFCRIFCFLLHFGSYYLILYPFILILGMIPFIGAITSFVLVLFAFIFAVMSYLFILIVSWIFARPLLAFLFMGAWIFFAFLGKIAKDKFADDGNQNNEQNSQNGFNNDSFGNRIEQTFLAAH